MHFHHSNLIQKSKNRKIGVKQTFNPVVIFTLLLRKALISICELAKEQGVSFTTDKTALTVDIVYKALQLAQEAGFGFAWHGGLHNMYIGTHWLVVTKANIIELLSAIAKIGSVHYSKADHHAFRDELYKQFRSVIKNLEPRSSESIKINCRNCTAVFGPDGVSMQEFARKDNFTYILNYDFDPEATAPMFQRVLDEALPLDAQMVLQEYIGSVFLPRFNLQKAAFMYGTGANSKSLVLSVISAALGKANVVEHSIESLCEDGSRTIADLDGKLLNVCCEMSRKFNMENFKKLIAKETMTARRLYGEPYPISSIPSLLFACNELPRSIEHTPAYFRRLIIIPFLKTIPEDKQDRTLGDRIIANELSGVLNWIIQGLERLLKQGQLTKSELVEKALSEYKIDIDSAASFIDDNNYEKAVSDSMSLQNLFEEYMSYCKDTNSHACSRKTFTARLRLAGFEIPRRSLGMVVLIKKSTPIEVKPQVVTSTMADLAIEDFFPDLEDDAVSEETQIVKEPAAVTDIALSEATYQAIEDIQ